MNIKMERSAFTLGIIALVTAIIFPVYAPMMCGSLAIIFAILSKGSNRQITMRGKIGIMLGVAGMIVNIVVCSASVYMVLNNPEMRNQFEELYEGIYGQPFEGFGITDGGDL